MPGGESNPSHHCGHRTVTDGSDPPTSTAPYHPPRNPPTPHPDPHPPTPDPDELQCPPTGRNADPHPNPCRDPRSTRHSAASSSRSSLCPRLRVGQGGYACRIRFHSPLYHYPTVKSSSQQTGDGTHATRSRTQMCATGPGCVRARVVGHIPFSLRLGILSVPV